MGSVQDRVERNTLFLTLWSNRYAAAARRTINLALQVRRRVLLSDLRCGRTVLLLLGDGTRRKIEACLAAASREQTRRGNQPDGR